MIKKITLGANAGIMPGDAVMNKKGKSPIRGVALKVVGGIVTVRPSDGNKPMDVLKKDIETVRTKDRLPAEIGCRVEIANGSQKGPGTLEHVNGGYNYVRVNDELVLELYPNEFTVKAVFRHADFIVGTVVRFVDPNKIVWGKRKRTTHGIVRGVTQKQILVQPLLSKGEHIVYLNEDEIVLEQGKVYEHMDESEIADLELAKLAIRALLVTCGSMTIGQLAGLLATQGVSEESVRDNVAAIIADGKAQLDKDHVFLSSNESDEVVQGPIRDRLVASTEAVRKAKTEMANAVFATIADTGSRLPR